MDGQAGVLSRRGAEEGESAQLGFIAERIDIVVINAGDFHRMEQCAAAGGLLEEFLLHQKGIAAVCRPALHRVIHAEGDRQGIVVFIGRKFALCNRQLGVERCVRVDLHRIIDDIF